MLYILTGQDDYTQRQFLEEIKRGLGDPTLSSANTAILDGQHLTATQLRSNCEVLPFLTQKRLVIVNGLLERFEPEGKAKQRKKSTPPTERQSEYKSLITGINEIPDSTILVLMDGKIGGRNPLLNELSSRAKVISFPVLRNAKLRQWVQHRLTEQQASIPPKAADLLVKLVGSNLWTMSSEIDKLILYTSGRRIEEEDVKAVVSSAQETNVFAMLDAVLDFKAGVAEQLLQQLLQRGAAPTYLLAMLSRQVQMIVRAKELRNQGKSEMEIRDRLGLTSEFASRKTLEQAKRYPLEQIKDVYRKLLEADLAIKTSRYDAELALNILICELCQREQI